MYYISGYSINCKVDYIKASILIFEDYLVICSPKILINLNAEQCVKEDTYVATLVHLLFLSIKGHALRSKKSILQYYYL